jgi:hypothetical protein
LIDSDNSISPSSEKSLSLEDEDSRGMLPIVKVRLG